MFVAEGRASIFEVAAELIAGGADPNQMVQPDGATALMVGIYFDSAWPMLLETAYSIDVRRWCSLGLTMQQRLEEVTRCLHALPNCLCSSGAFTS